MTIPETIKKAIEGGYDNFTDGGFPSPDDFPENYEIKLSGKKIIIKCLDKVDPDHPTLKFVVNLKELNYYAIFLDPDFWKALGKAMGWKVNYYKDDDWLEDGTLVNIWKPEWLYQQHRFIDHLAEGKDAESFFKEL